jgi:peptidoglycan-associated lipoprotein
MIIRVSFAALVVAAGLSGCASTSESPQGTTTTGAASSDGQQSSSLSSPGRAQPRNPGQAMSDPRSDASAKRSVYYEFDGYDVKPEYRGLVEEHAKHLRQNPQARITIEGNADERGSREYNVALGQRRAESVMKMMRLLGVAENQIEAVSFGEEKPRAQGHDDTSWGENRRSDFVRQAK